MSTEGYGTETGVFGGYGEEDVGYGSLSTNEAWHIVSVLEEALPYSEISQIQPAGFGTGELREDGGELVILGSTGGLSEHVHQVELRPVGTSLALRAYSGVMGQGFDIQPDLDRGWLVFVAPMSPVIGAVDIVITRPAGEVTLSGLLSYVPYADRSGSRLLRSLFPDNWGVGDYDPSV